MRKIVPFNNVLKFNTNVSEITAISLENDIKKSSDVINGVFYISGEYKIMNGGLEKEKFNFDLPFDIALGAEYNLETLEVDVDDFRYDLIDSDKLKVSIDLFLDGEEVVKIEDEDREEVLDDPDDAIEEENFEPAETPIRKLDLLDDMLSSDSNEEEVKNDLEESLDMNNINNVNTNNNESNNIFNNFNETDEYVTYRVYRVVEDDTIDKIMEKYDVTKEELLNYNSNLEDIKPGDKLIIPSK